MIDKILSFCLAKNGKIWLGSNGYGLYCYNYDKDGKTHVKSFTTNNGLANNTVKGIVEDNQGMLWIATDNGLSVFNPKTETFSSFYREDGLLSSQFYFNGAIRNAKGEIFLGTDQGMMAVQGLNLSVLYAGKLRFTELLVDNQPVFAGSDYLDEDISIARKLSIHESDKSFTINFSALNYGSGTQGVYLYRMTGYENEWVQLKPGQHSVRYSTLPAGKYKFEVKYIPSINSDKEQVISIDVTVTPYFWKSWWFITILVIGIIALLQYAYVRRLNKMREREVEALYRPIEAALKDSDEPEKLQSRIQMILRNQQRYQESQKKSIEADKKQVVENTHPFMESVMEVMEKNYDNSEFGVQELSDAMGLNRSVLSKKLTAETGLPTAQFIRNYRLDIAKKMIVDNGANRNITEIAYRVGFNDPKYFTRCFTKLYGVSPTSFRDAREDEKVEKMRALKQHFIEGVEKIENTTIHGLYDETSAPHIISVGIAGIRSEVLLHALEDKGIYVSSGSACASNHPQISGVLKGIGAKQEYLDATIRFSMSEFTTLEEIDYTLDALYNIVPMLRRYTRH